MSEDVFSTPVSGAQTRKSKTPWIKFYASDWLAGTRALSPSETGIYITLIAMMYERASPIKRDDRKLARLCNCPAGLFKRSITNLIEDGKLIERDGMLTNERAEAEIIKRENVSVSRSYNGSCTNTIQEEKSQQNQQSDKSNADIPFLPEARVEEVKEKIHKKKKSEPTSEPDPCEHFETFWQAYPKRPNDPKKAARQKFELAVKRGVDPGTIIEGAKRYALYRKGQDPQYTKQARAWLYQECWDVRDVPSGTDSKYMLVSGQYVKRWQPEAADV